MPTKFFAEKGKGQRISYAGDSILDENIILKYVRKKKWAIMLTGFIWLKLCSVTD
jgi:hypothetical protein